MIYFCCEEGRRLLVSRHPSLGGIDHLEVVHHEIANVAEQQRTLRVFFVRHTSAAVDAAVRNRFTNPVNNRKLVVLTGGERIRQIRIDAVEWRNAQPATAVQPEIPEHLHVHVTPRGDFSRYTLQLTEPDSNSPLKELDPALASIDFSFKVECESDFDCRPATACPPHLTSTPELDYLARDYASLRQLMLDRLSVVAPEWRERNPADLGITLVELIAYVGDYLSYRQDAIGTEAYLGTARRRISLRRHARLLDYAMHDGCNARVWIQVRVKSDVTAPVRLPAPGTGRIRFATRLSDLPVLPEPDFDRLVSSGRAEVFEPMEAAELHAEHNLMYFHTWGNTLCCLPAGATKATLRGHFPRLRPGQVLIFAERLGAGTGDVADADPQRRHAVRLIRVNGLTRAEFDALAATQSLPHRTDPVLDPPVDITEIEWSTADALPFPLCLSTRVDGRLCLDVSAAAGNIVLADHGMKLNSPEPLPAVPTPSPALAPVAADGCGACCDSERPSAPIRYRPRLAQAPVTIAADYDPSLPAAAAFGWEMSSVSPVIRLRDSQARQWAPQPDLLSSDALSPEFVVEIESDGQAALRFGDDTNGLAPRSGTGFDALYRIGNGARGNVGADSIIHLVASDDLAGIVSQVDSIGNPLPARGGTEPEAMEIVRQAAPAAFRIQQRAVTPQDYADKAGLHREVQRAAATLRWTGSWHTIFLSVDRRGGLPVDSEFETDLRSHLERYRLAGHDLEIDGPQFVSLELELNVCVDDNYFRGDVVAALALVLDRHTHANGSRGFFHPDNFTFGQSVQLSRLYAVAMRIPGIRHVNVAILRRQGDLTAAPVPDSDVFEIGRLEIARLDNDPNFPDRGVLRILPTGGR